MAPELQITVEDQVFDNWGPDTITFRETREIERVYGKPFSKFSDDLDEGSMSARQVLAWSLLKRENTAVKLDDLLDLTLSQVTIAILCSECKAELTAKGAWGTSQVPPVAVPGPERTKLVHDDGRESCGDEPTDPTPGEGPVLSATPEPSEPATGESDTSPTSPTSSGSDPGSGIV